MQYSSLRILLVDDNPSYLSTLSEILATENHEVCVASDGVSGWQCFVETQPDLVLADVRMPGMDGLTLTSKINTAHALHWVPVLLMSANSSVENQLKAYQAGCDDFLAKPFDPGILLAKIAVYQRVIIRVQTASK